MNLPASFKILLIILFLFVLTHNSFGQNYGLAIATTDESKENNTALDLSPGSPLCLDGNFEISFEASSLYSGLLYGYIVRIIENNERNFDLIYNSENPENLFGIVVGDYRTKIRLNIAPENFLKNWNKISIKFDADKDRLIVSDGHKTYVEGNLHLKKKGCYKLFFGANGDKKFKTTEALSVKLRNIRILKNGITKYYWPLDEHEGEVAHELINGNNGSIKYPFWMASMHQKWEKVGDFVVNGAASTAFDRKEESLFVIGEDSLFTFSLPNSSLSSKSNLDKFKMSHGSQSVFSPINNNIYNFLPGQKMVARYSVINQKWNKKLPYWQEPDYWQANKLISPRDSSMYVFAGYGHFRYKNTVQRFSLKTEQWEQIKPKGDFFTPRYLAGLGSNPQGDTVYVLGGYGSSSGSQMVNSSNIYNMMRFTTKDQTFKKLYDLKNHSEDFAFASSLVIDNSSKTYYGLAFPQRKYNSSLRLIVGSLNNSSYKHVGSAIPYSFHDIRSFADLFYCPESKKFIAVTLLRSKNDQTKVSIYTLQGPPLDFVKSNLTPKYHPSRLFIGLTLFFALLGGGLILYLRNKKRHTSTGDQIKPLEPSAKPNVSAKNAIFLFGDLQVFDRNGTDITKLFTPLLKELFLLLLVNSVKNGRGLHAEKLDEILWFGRTEKSVRNNRSVNIVKLKSILERIEHCQLLKDADYWKIELDYDFWYIDYHNYLNLIEDKKKLDEEKIKLLFELTRRGNFLSNHNYEWLDKFKSEISNEVIDVLLSYANSAKPYNPEFLIQIASYIFYFDPVSEEAMIIKCKALSSLGKHSLAKKAFDVFIKDYRSIYNEDFNKNFNQII
ncbi:MAG: kelch repeat-containing protein [Mucilaginibacter sp.]|uniref:Kelch repeat-containing protein n=1 Tax=Mucilaginibacter sp. TaxID=1882438 RepID=UPI0032632B23